MRPAPPPSQRVVRIPPDQIRNQAEELRSLVAGIEGASVEEGIDMPVLHLPRERLLEGLQILRDGSLAFRHCSMLTAVDRMPEEPRFEVVYGLYSIEHNRWVRVKTRCGEFDAVVPSVTGLWPGANWLERECYDLFGIRFADHPDLRRILMPEGYEGFPLRKEFPREGIEPGRLYREWERRRQEPPAAAAGESAGRYEI